MLTPPVSMNMWGLSPDFINILETGFDEFLANTPQEDLKAEYLLPTIIGDSAERKQSDTRSRVNPMTSGLA